MVVLSDVQLSNSLIATTLPPRLVAVFVGGTSGIGEAALKAFTKQSRQPRAYVVGRSQDAAERIIAECRALNPQGEYTFLQADVSLIRVVDKVCAEIAAKEDAINILFLSAGGISFERKETSEHLHMLAATAYYSRSRFITNLLPLLNRASALRRVVTVAGAGNEGMLYPSDLQARLVPLIRIRGHLTTLITLGLEAVARTAPEVSFVHDYPGAVNTPIFSRSGGVTGVLIRALMYCLERWICVPLEESGERHLYLATSARYAPASAGASDGVGVPLGDGVGTAQGTTGKTGSGVYSVGWDCESSGPAVQKVLADYRDAGMVDEIWQHTQGEYDRITAQDDESIIFK